MPLQPTEIPCHVTHRCYDKAQAICLAYRIWERDGDMWPLIQMVTLCEFQADPQKRLGKDELLANFGQLLEDIVAALESERQKERHQAGKSAKSSR